MSMLASRLCFLFGCCYKSLGLSKDLGEEEDDDDDDDDVSVPIIINPHLSI